MGETIALIVVLIFAAMVLFMLEILTPTLGLLATLGVASLIAAIWMGFTLHPAVGWILLVSLTFLTPVYLALLVRFLPNTALGKRIFLRRLKSSRGEGTPEAEKYQALVGKTGVTETPLHPSGAVRIDNQRVIALAESDMIEKDRTVLVIKATGTNVIVRESSQD